ncbi:MAG TPA: lipoyl synthase, partial [Gemmatimonadales bacterium]
IAEIRRRRPGTSVEVLIPDFKGSEQALRIVVDAKPDIVNHNLETIERLYRLARPGGRYSRALELLRRAKEMDPGTLTKSGIICGLGEEWDELLVAMRDLRAQDVDILTIGQYLRPSTGHLPIARYYTPDEFAALRRHGLEMGYRHVEAGPLVRSSYHAWEQVERATATR